MHISRKRKMLNHFCKILNGFHTRSFRDPFRLDPYQKWWHFHFYCCFNLCDFKRNWQLCTSFTLKKWRQTMLEYFSFLSFVKSGESHSNELSSKHCTFLRDAELLKALGNCQLNVHDELFPSPPTAFLHPIFWHQFHIVHGSKMCHCPLPL